MNIRITPTLLKGHIEIPSSKSEAHRALLCAGLALPGSRVSGITDSADITATRQALKGFETDGIIPCNESGSTLRFMLPIALARGGSFVFTGKGRLLERPLDEYFKIFQRQGITYNLNAADGKLSVSGRLKSGVFLLRGDVSSQYITGLLLALPMLEGDSEIVLTTPLQSASYVEMTCRVMKAFGVQIQKTESGYAIPGGQKYRPCDYEVEADYSQAAFWLVANALGSSVSMQALSAQSVQGDQVIAEILQRKRRSLLIDVGDCPDLVPILAVYCCFCEGESRIVNAARLRFKESDRLYAIAKELNAIGGSVTEERDALQISGKGFLQGGKADSHNDHRIAMALAIAATRCEKEVLIQGAECVGKSYVDFWEHYRQLGGKADEC